VLLKKTVADIRRRAAEAGRDPHSILIFNLQTVIVGDTDREAQAKWQEYKQYVSYEGALALLSGWTGIDFGQYQPDQVLKYLHTNAIQSAVEAFSTADPEPPVDGAGPGRLGGDRRLRSAGGRQRANRGGRTAVLGRRDGRRWL
jgi:alkanesulfonate monooxygenase SsuD/methylene tetrahydromethanopterin reductase-like flavin-dependent oxidoreductase (luciferase family)